MIMINYDCGVDRPILNPDNQEKLFDWVINRYRKQIENLEWLDDDRIPYVAPVTGTEIFAQAFGCPVVYPHDNMPFARPVVFNSGELTKIKLPKLENTPLMDLFDRAHKLLAAAPGAVLGVPDIQSPLDIAALVWEKADFFMALYDENEAAKDLIAMTGSLLTEFLDLWFRTFGREFIAHCPDYYMPYGITLSEDEIGSISVELFRHFSFPSLCDLSDRYGGRIGIHCCANAKHQWEQLKSIPGLVLLNLVQPNNVLREGSSYFSDTIPQMWWAGKNDCLDFRSRAVLSVTVHSKEEALEQLYKLKELSAHFCHG
jgi:hypothetical protein